MIPLSAADPSPHISGSDDKIDVLYIGNTGYFDMPVSFGMESSMVYGDDFNIQTIGINYPTMADLTSYDLSSFDFIFLDMAYYGINSQDWGLFEEAHDNGVTLIAFMNDWSGSTQTPDYFDFRDTPDFTTSTTYSGDAVKTFFLMFNDQKDNYAAESDELKQDYAENILMFLAKERSKTDTKCAAITNDWETVKIAYLGFSGQENWGLVNAYSSFMDVTFLPDYWTEAGNQAIVDFGNAGGFANQNVILLNMITDSYCQGFDDLITTSNYKLENVAKTKPVLIFNTGGYGPDYAEEIDDKDHPLSIDVQINEQILVLAGREFGSTNPDHFTKDWILKSASPAYGIYHPDLPDKTYATLDDYLANYSTEPGPYDTPHHVYNSSNVTVGLWFHKEYFSDGRLPIINAVIADLESKGVNVIATYDIFRESDDGNGNPINPTMKYFADSNGDVLIGAAISIKDFSFNYDDYETGLEWLDELNVTVLKAVTTASNGQISKDSLVYSTVSPNRDGMSDFILIGGPVTDGSAIIYPEQINWLNNRAIAWANLKAKDNADKKIAIIYYNYPPGKDGVGANYLNVMRSFAGCETTQFPGLLRQLKDEGYTVSFDKVPVSESGLNETNLLDLVFRQGINVGAYAPGVLNTMVDERGNTADADWWGSTMVPVETYQEWFDATVTNTTIRNGIIDSWGEPWNYSKPLSKDQSGMIWQDSNGKRFIVIPAIRFGNVWLTPQPDRALSTDKAFSYHSGDIPPTHQYVAYYLWLQNEFKPDAIINFGTHGTHEWLPGSPHGMNAEDDLSPLLLGDIPNIYPYIVANVGEGLTAEYRGNALIIDHMTPPMIRSNLDSNADLEWLEKEIQAYFIAQAGGDSSTNAQRQKDIVIRMFAAGIDDIIGMEKYKRLVNETNPEKVTDAQLQTYLKGLPQDDFSKFLKEDLFDYVESVKENSLPYGMHVYGQSPTDEQIGAMLRNMWGHGFDNALYEAYYKDLGYLSIPYADEEIIHQMVVDLADATTKDEMMNILDIYYPADRYTDTDHEIVVRFILGPAMYMEEAADADGVIAEWNSIQTGEDSNGNPVTVMDEIREEVVFAYYFYSDVPSKDKLNTSIRNVTAYCIHMRDDHSRMIDADLIDEALSFEFNTQSHQNKGVTSYLTGYGRLDYAQNLKDCGDCETESLMRALSGGYIWPNAGNDPIQNPSALPTGKNFYGIDPDKFPTKAAWEVGKSLADQLVIDYYKKYGKFPDTVSFSRFGVEFIRDEGALEACALYLMGVEPVWDVNGKVDPKSVKVIPLSELTITFYDEKQKKEVTINRPRIDVVYTTAGMRDAFGDKLKLINVGVKAAATQDEPNEWNYVKKNSEKLKAAGLENMMYFRCFANEPGNYEIGTGNLVSASGSWDDPQAIVDMYLKNMGYVYGDDSTWGASAQDLLKALLKNVDASVHADSSNLYDTLDNDDFFQYFGALNMATKYLRDDKKMPEMYVADTKNVGQDARTSSGKMYGMKEYINMDLESRYLNEEWIKGMMESGYSGSTMYSEFVENLFGWAATSDGELISYENWKKVYDVYVNDSYELGLDDYFKENPYAYQSLTARLIESMRKDYFTAQDLKETDPVAYNERMKEFQAMQKALMEKYMDSVIQSGVACCHHTCGNPSLDKFIAGQMSVLGINPDEYEDYWKNVEDATEREKPSISPNPSTSSGGGFGTAAVSSGPSESSDSGETPSDGTDASGGYGTDGTTPGTPGAPVSGYEMTSTIQNAANSIRDFMTNPTFSSSSIFAIAIVVLVIGAVFYGYRKKNI
ncbi:cobaltochelatase subunit CobN [Methanolapillus millepedarum]